MVQCHAVYFPQHSVVSLSSSLVSSLKEVPSLVGCGEQMEHDGEG